MKILNDKIQSKMFIIISVLLIILKCLEQIFLIHIPWLLPCFIIIVYSIFCKKEYFNYIFSFLLPLSLYFNIAYINISLIFIFLVRFRTSLRISQGFFWMPFILLIELFHCIISEESIKVFLGTSIIYIAPMFFLFINRQLKTSWKIIWCFIYGYMATCFISLGAISYNLGISTIFSTRFGMGNFRKLLDPFNIVIMEENYLAIYSSIIITLLFICSIYRSDKKIYYYILMIIPATMIILSGSKTGVVLVLLTILTILGFYFIRNVYKFGGLLIIIITLMVSVIYTVSSKFPDFFKRNIERYLVTDLTSGRTEIFSKYHDFLFDHMISNIWGLGSQNYRIKVGMIDSAHNAYQQVWVMWGIVGLFLFIVLLLSLYIYMNHNILVNINICVLPLILLLIAMLTIQVKIFFDLIFPTAYALSFVYLTKRRN